MDSSRRLAAIMFTDIVGYTTSMQQSEEAAMGQANRHQIVLDEQVRKHRGEILNYYGDGSLSIFSSALAAVQCAMDIQYQLQGAPAVPLRIGIHIGEVLFDQGKVFGSGVNIASRIEALGIAGSILLSKEVRNKIHNRSEFSLASMGSFEFKNVDEPVYVFAIANDGFVVPQREELNSKVQAKHKEIGKNSTPAWSKILSAIIIFLTGGMAGWLLPSDPGSTPANKGRSTSVTLPDHAPVALVGSAHHSIGQRAFDISPDGQSIVYVAHTKHGSQLALRSMNAFNINLIPGTQGAYHPFFSPDGDWVAYYANSRLYKVSLSGMEPILITTVTDPYSGIWLANDDIIFVNREGGQLVRVSATDNQAKLEIIPVENPKSTWTQKLWIAQLPDPEYLLISYAFNEIFAVHIPTGKLSSIYKGGSTPRYLSSGHLIFTQWGRLLAARFDAKKLVLTSTPIPVMENLRTESVRNGSQFAISDQGTLVYVSGRSVDQGSIVFVNRKGEEIGTPVLPPGFYRPFQLSSDQNFLAYHLQEDFYEGDAAGTIYIYDIQRNVSSQLATRSVGLNWLPGSKEISYSQSVGDRWMILKHSPDKAAPDTIMERSHYIWPSSWSTDYRYLSTQEYHDASLMDLNVVDLFDTSHQEWMIGDGPSNELFSCFSPRGEHIVYESDESGISEIYVKPFPPTGNRIKISKDGGSEPLWVSGGDEIVYRSANFDKMVSVTIDWSNGFAPSTPTILWEGSYLDIPGRSYHVTDDGKYFLMKKSVESSHIRNELRVIENWVEKLKDVVTK